MVANVGPTNAAEGANVTFTVTVSNSGPNAATGVVLTVAVSPHRRVEHRG